LELPNWPKQKSIESLWISVRRHDDWRNHAWDALIGYGSNQLPGV
jgi:hypothetical protein